MHDGIHIEKAGKPAVTICTDIFIETSHAMAEMWGAPNFPLIFTPHPIAHLSREQLRERAEAMLEEIVTILTGKTVSATSASWRGKPYDKGGEQMERRDIRADSPTEKARGFMPAVSINPGRLLFTAGMTGRQPNGSIVEGGMGPQTQRTFERLRAIVERASGSVEQSIKQMLYVTDLEAYYAQGRAARAGFFDQSRPASTGLVVRRLADPAMLIEVELVVDLQEPPQGGFKLEKFDVEAHGLDFFQGVIVNGGRLIYLAGQVANNPDGSVAGVGDLSAQAQKVYDNIGYVLQAAGATAASAVKETTWTLDLEAWREHGTPVRRAFYQGDFPASTLVEIPGLARPEFLVEIEVIAAVA